MVVEFEATYSISNFGRTRWPVVALGWFVVSQVVQNWFTGIQNTNQVRSWVEVARSLSDKIGLSLLLIIPSCPFWELSSSKRPFTNPFL